MKTHGVYPLHRQIGIKEVMSECECVCEKGRERVCVCARAIYFLDLSAKRTWKPCNLSSSEHTYCPHLVFQTLFSMNRN